MFKTSEQFRLYVRQKKANTTLLHFDGQTIYAVNMPNGTVEHWVYVAPEPGADVRTAGYQKA